MSNEKKIPEGNVLTPKFRVAFPFLFKPRPAQEEGGKSKFEVTMLFDKSEDLSALKKACEVVMTEKFGTDRNKWPKGYRKPFRDGDESSHLAGFAGCIFVAAKTSQPVGMVDERCVPIISEEGMYAGCYARAVVRPFWYDNKGNKGLSFFLNGIQRVMHGERFVNKPRPEEMFQTIDGDQEEDSFTSGGKTEDYSF